MQSRNLEIMEIKSLEITHYSNKFTIRISNDKLILLLTTLIISLISVPSKCFYYKMTRCAFFMAIISYIYKKNIKEITDQNSKLYKNISIKKSLDLQSSLLYVATVPATLG
ncbi:unnamed protein product [Chrysodeixis includens]|uniref:Uncharacterized protein n=1 Tax=Chrysodeixis includens TaxID=689277 RepID=A0A9N8KV22_CHRIL|nr:unnamed protein product [Chrysodeixis includens]